MSVRQKSDQKCYTSAVKRLRLTTRFLNYVMYGNGLNNILIRDMNPSDELDNMICKTQKIFVFSIDQQTNKQTRTPSRLMATSCTALYPNNRS